MVYSKSRLEQKDKLGDGLTKVLVKHIGYFGREVSVTTQKRNKEVPVANHMHHLQPKLSGGKSLSFGVKQNSNEMQRGLPPGRESSLCPAHPHCMLSSP